MSSNKRVLLSGLVSIQYITATLSMKHLQKRLVNNWNLVLTIKE